MPSLVLHSYRRCPFAIRVRMVLEEKGLNYQIIEEDLSNRSAELMRLHPEGKVPLLIHGEFAIPESSVITEYLDDLFPTPALRPKSPQALAELRLWTYWCNQIFKPDLDEFKYGLAAMSEEERTVLLDRVRNHLARLAAPLEERPFLLGSELTLADIHVFPFFRQLMRARPDAAELLKPSPRLQDWLTRITSRPSFERVMKKPN